MNVTYLKLKIALKWNITDLHDYENLNVTTIQFSTSVTGLAAFFGSVPPKAELDISTPLNVAQHNIERSRNVQRSKNSGVPVTQPAGWGGESSELTKANLFRKGILAVSRTIL